MDSKRRQIGSQESKAMMFLKKILFLTLMMFLYCNLSYAGDLVSAEATKYYNEGVKAQKESNFAAAEIAYQKTLLLDPYNPKWQKFIINNRGIIYAKQGDLRRAEAAFKSALEIDSHYAAAQLNLGLVYEMRRGKLQTLEYWSKVFDIESLKPKNFVIEGEKGFSEKK